MPEAATPEEPTKRRPLRAVAIVATIIIGVVLVALVGVNVFVRTAYAPFYDQATREFPIPGVGEGFVPQDLDYLDDANEWLFSGYMADGLPSPIYKRALDGSVAQLAVELPDGSEYRGHGSAITSTDRYVLITRDEGYLVFDAAEVAAARNGETIRAIGSVDMDFSPAFMNIENDTLYAGNFYFPGDYETPDHHRITTADGTENPAILYAYPADEQGAFGFAEKAARAYSIPGLVQGVAVTPDDQLVLSASYGLRSSHLLAYDMAQLAVEGEFIADGETVPLYALDGRALVGDVEAPPMTEGIESHGGRIYIAEESACNKYIFGKLYGAGYVYAITL